MFLSQSLVVDCETHHADPVQPHCANIVCQVECYAPRRLTGKMGMIELVLP